MNAKSPTVAALLTPLAPGAIAVVGLTGPHTDAICAEILRTPKGGSLNLKDRRPSFCKLMDGRVVLDDVVAVRLRQGVATAVELNTHGGVRIVQRTLSLLKRHGATLVDGDVYRRRFSTEGDVAQAVDQALIGAGSRRLAEWLLRQRMILPPFLSGKTEPGEREREGFVARSQAAIHLLRGLHVAIVGPPNAGKSTLANRLIGTERVVTSREKGTTRDWVSETALICGWPVTLTDTAGIRETESRIETQAIRRGRARAETADVIIVLLDACESAEVRRRAWEHIAAMLPADRPTLVAQNKCDRPEAAPPPRTGLLTCNTSALTGLGIHQLEQGVSKLLGLDLLDDALPTAFLPGQLAPAIRPRLKARRQPGVGP